jgi:hypothetical protein
MNVLLTFSFENVLNKRNYYAVDNDHPDLIRRRHQA